MKRIYSILTLLSLTLCIHAQQTDPALTAAVTAQTVTLKSLFDARHSTQEKILAATGIENVQLQQLHDIERKVLDYMANVSGLMQNLYQVKRTTELVTVEIPRNISEVTKACQGHLKGTAIALAVSDEIRSVYTEIGSLSALCTSLVKTKTVSICHGKTSGEDLTRTHGPTICRADGWLSPASGTGMTFSSDACSTE